MSCLHELSEQDEARLYDPGLDHGRQGRGALSAVPEHRRARGRARAIDGAPAPREAAGMSDIVERLEAAAEAIVSSTRMNAARLRS